MTNTKINSDDKFVRWQGVLREHLSFINNLILTLSVGVVGFVLSLLGEDNFNPNCCQKIFLTSGLIICLLSIALGFVTSFNRLQDFRTTLKKIKNDLMENSNENEAMKGLIDMYGKITWGFFYGQMVAFCMSILSLTIAFILIYQSKLF